MPCVPCTVVSFFSRNLLPLILLHPYRSNFLVWQRLTDGAVTGPQKDYSLCKDMYTFQGSMPQRLVKRGNVSLQRKPNHMQGEKTFFFALT